MQKAIWSYITKINELELSTVIHFEDVLFGQKTYHVEYKKPTELQSTVSPEKQDKICKYCNNHGKVRYFRQH